MKIKILMTLLFVSLISCEKDYDLIADICTFDSAGNQTCPMSGTSQINEDIQIEKAELQTFEFLNLNYGTDQGQLTFELEFSHELDKDSIFYSGTELDNITLLGDQNEKLYPQVVVDENTLIVTIPKSLQDPTLILGPNIRDKHGRELKQTKSFKLK